MRYSVFRSDVSFDPTATADKLFGGLLAEGVPVAAADARSPPLLIQAGATHFGLWRTGTRVIHEEPSF